MKISNKGIRFIRQAEGWECNVYKDVAGLPTIGVGHLLTQDELASGEIKISGDWVDYSKGLSGTQVNCLLDQDLDRFEKAVNAQVVVPLSQNEFDALVSFAFNVGIAAFTNSTLLRRLNNNLKSDVPAQMKRWVRSGGKIVPGLINRRNKEVALWSMPYAQEPDHKLKPPRRTFIAQEGAYFNHIHDPDKVEVELIGDWREA